MNNVWMILLGTLLATACHASQTDPVPATGKVVPVAASASAAVNGVVEIRFDEQVREADLELQWLEVNDSRCPIDVNCFRAGEVKVILEVITTETQKKTPAKVQLILDSRQRSNTASVSGYELELLSVFPYPQDEVTPKRSSYLAEIRISKAAQTR